MATITKLSPKFEWIVFSPRDTSPSTQPYIDACYELWHELWLATFAELDGAKALASDDFTRHEKVGALYCGGRPLALVLLSSFDLLTERGRRDSCFGAWPEDLLMQVGENHPGKSVLVCCYLSVSPEWRRKGSGISIKNFLASLVVEEFKVSDCTAMICTLRVNKGMNFVCYDLGAKSLKSGQLMHGVEVDLAMFEQGPEVGVKDPELSPLVADTFGRRKDLTNPVERKEHKRSA